MNRKLFCLISLIIILSLVTGSAGVLAQGPQPPKPVAPQREVLPSHSPGNPLPGSQPFRPQPPSVDRENTPSIELGQSGLSFRYEKLLGVTEEPYPADGQHLNVPDGLFIDAGNNLYITEVFGQRLLKFNPSGANLLAIGHAGMGYHHDDYLSFPEDVAVSNDGHMWVVMNPAVKEFDTTGTPLQVFPADEPWLSGEENDRFNDPKGIAFDSAGRLFVSDTGNHRIQVYQIISGTPVYSTTIGTTGVPVSDNTGFDSPLKLAFDNLGRLYVMDRGNFRVQRCSYSAGWTCSTFFGETGVQGDDLNHLADWAAGIAIRNNDVYLTDGYNVRVLKCTLSGVCSHFAGTNGEQGHDNSHFMFPYDVAVDSANNVYVSDTDNHRVQKFNSSGIYQSTIGVSGVPYLVDNTRLYAPWGVAMALDGGLIVLENVGKRLVKYDLSGDQQWTVGEAGVWGSDNAHFNNPTGNPAIDSLGHIYVTDSWNHRVQIFDSTGNYFTTMGQPGISGSGNNLFNCPTGAAINPVNGDIVVADTCNERIQVFTSNRIYKTTLGTPEEAGDDNSHFNRPMGVAVDASGYIYVADNQNFRVQKCSYSASSYNCTPFVGETGVFDSNFGHINPTSITLDRFGRVYITDEWNSRLQVFDNTGAYLTTIGGVWGSNSSQFIAPLGVAVDQQGVVYVADTNNHRVQKYALGVPGWRQKNINGFGDQTSTGVSSLEIFDDQLYAGTWNWNKGGSIWRSPDGSSWMSVTEPGFGSVYTNTNPVITDLIIFNGQLYAGTGWDVAGGQVWRSPNGTVWEKVVDNGFGDPYNKAIALFTVFNNNLYACTRSKGAHGLEIWRSATGNILNWSRVASNGFDGNPKNVNCTGFAAFNGDLYTATESITENPDGIEIWRTNTGNPGTWTQVNDTGFTDLNNFSAGAMAIYKGFLYVGTANDSTGAQLWRTDTGTSWEPVIDDGFGDSNNYKIDTLYVFDNKLYVGVDNNQTGVEIWRTSDGSNWHQINPDGFGDSNNLAVVLWSNGITSFNDSLYMGTYNPANGGELWQLLKPLYLPMLRR